MSDWTHKPIGEVVVGDEVAGFRFGENGKKHKLSKSKVLTIQSRKSDIVKITMESGRQIRCTPDHNWWTGRFDKTHRRYAPAKIGSKLQYILEPQIGELEEKDRVVSIEPDGHETVYALETETGNYIAWGYGSKNCLYRNNPVDDEDALFKSVNFRFYGRLKPSDKPLQTGMYDKLFITGALDPAGQGKDRTGGTVCGTDNEMKIHVLEVLSKHLKPDQMVDWIIDMNIKYRFKLFGIETRLYQGMLRQELEKRIKEEQKRNPFFKNFGIREFMPSRGETKFIRISALQPWHERGDILFPGSSLNSLSAGFSDLAYQMLQVTPTHMPEPNDIVDSLQMHLSMIQAGGVVEVENVPVNSPAWLEKKWVEEWNKNQKRLPRMRRRTYRTWLS